MTNAAPSLSEHAPLSSVPSVKRAPRAVQSPADARRERRLGDPKLRAAVEAVLRLKKAPPSLVEDLASETLTRACGCRFLPDDDDGFRQYVCGMARKVVADHQRDRDNQIETRGLSADAHANEGPVARGESLEAKITVSQLLAAEHVGTGRGIRWFLRHVRGEDYATIAGEEGLDYKTVWDAAHHSRDQVEKWIAYGAMIAVIVLLVFAVMKDWSPPRQDVADPNKQKTVAPAPKPLGKVEPTKVDQAVALRETGRAACAVYDWRACSNAFEQAEDLDPEGGKDPAVRRMKHLAQDGYMHEAKGGHWKPKPGYEPPNFDMGRDDP